MTVEKLPAGIQILRGLNAYSPNAASPVVWQPFHPGVQICRLYGDGLSGPSAALIHFEPGSSIPRHAHTGYEHIYILSGSQTDDHGHFPEGTLVINPPGTHHAIFSETGCLVLAIYEKPVRFLEDEAPFASTDAASALVD